MIKRVAHAKQMCEMPRKDEKIKRVACLYRVSTKYQLIDDEIPMQIKACADFIRKQGTWELKMEYIEKGVSGYHKSADDRDALVQLKKDAAAGKFDVLLLFMFDRLGRREDETPFIVEWLVNHGIEVWSVCEGQQRFDDHADKLINYMRYWQSGGESELNSMRVAEKHNQLVMEGRFRGGVAPFGYRPEYSGEYNRRGYERKKLVIYEPEAVIVRRIFELSRDVEMGSYKVAKILNDEGFLTRHGNKWTVPTIVRTLRNTVYKGDYVAGKVRRNRGKKVASQKETWVHSRELVPELMIVSEAVWEQVNANISRRDTRINAIPRDAWASSQVAGASSSRRKRPASCSERPAHDKNGFLLNDIAYCGYCKAKMHPRISRSKRIRRSGKVAVYSSKYYFCPRKGRQDDCDGYIQHGTKRMEAAVLDEVYRYLSNLKTLGVPRLAAVHKTKMEKEQSQKLKAIEQKIASLRKEVALLEEEIIRCLMGTSTAAETQLSEIISVKTNQLSALETKKASIEAELEAAVSRMDELAAFQNTTVSWKKEFAAADTGKQAHLISLLINHVCISRESVDISFKFDLHNIEAFVLENSLAYRNISAYTANE